MCKMHFWLALMLVSPTKGVTHLFQIRLDEVWLLFCDVHIILKPQELISARILVLLKSCI